MPMSGRISSRYRPTHGSYSTSSMENATINHITIWLIVEKESCRMEDKVSREAKLNAAKEIVATYIKSAVIKKGEDQKLDLSADEVCNLFRKVYDTIDETLPDKTRRVGLGV
jgi:hypothetical protein